MTDRPGIANRPVVIAQVAVALLLAVKLYFSIFTPPIGDEAYYWMWGQHLGWSYFDHPPLHAWLLRLVSLIFGWNLFSLRLLTWLTFGGTLWIFWSWAKRLKPEDPAAWFWPSTAIYLASPLFFLMSSIAFHDHLLIFLCLASVHLFLLFAEKWEASGKAWGWLYAAAAVLGLAVLTKYNGVLVGVGVAAFFAARRQTRPLFRSPHLYLAALLSIALQAPVFYWNLTEGLASYKFHLSDRWTTPVIGARGNHLLEFVITALVAVSPFLFPAIFGMVRRAVGSDFGDRARMLALSIFVTSTLAMALISLVVQTYFYWNITAFLRADAAACRLDATALGTRPPRHLWPGLRRRLCLQHHHRAARQSARWLRLDHLVLVRLARRRRARRRPKASPQGRLYRDGPLHHCCATRLCAARPGRDRHR